MKLSNNKICKIIIDILLLLGLIGCAVSTSVFEKNKPELMGSADVDGFYSWNTPHCILSLTLIAVIFIHLWQHWDLMKKIMMKNLYLKNKLTTITGVIFFITIISILLYLTGFTMNNLHFHNIIAHLFVFVVVVHFILNFKKFIFLFKNR